MLCSFGSYWLILLARSSNIASKTSNLDNRKGICNVNLFSDC